MEVLIPIIAVGGFFGTVIAFILSRTYLAKLKAQSQAGGAAGQEDVLAAVHELRRGGGGTPGRGKFFEGLAGPGPGGGGGEKGPRGRRPGAPPMQGPPPPPPPRWGPTP